MNENEWTQSICELVRQSDLGDNIAVETLCKLPYALEVSSFNADWSVASSSPTVFETDMVIFEVRNEQRIPRVVIEAKLGSVTTHDAITYSNKAICHKQVMPYLRYGIMLGNRETYPLPGRLFRHGTHFDFLFSFVNTVPSEEEKTAFVEMLKREIRYSQQTEDVLTNSRRHNRKRYFMLQKELHFGEFPEE